jgi:hypothetical protein
LKRDVSLYRLTLETIQFLTLVLLKHSIHWYWIKHAFVFISIKNRFRNIRERKSNVFRFSNLICFYEMCCLFLMPLAFVSFVLLPTIVFVCLFFSLFLLLLFMLLLFCVLPLVFPLLFKKKEMHYNVRKRWSSFIRQKILRSRLVDDDGRARAGLVSMFPFIILVI